MGEQSLMDACDDPGNLDWLDWPELEKKPFYAPLQTTPNKKTWALFILAGLLMFPAVGWGWRDLAGLCFIGALFGYLGATYTWYKHNEDHSERNKVLDTIEQL